MTTHNLSQRLFALLILFAVILFAAVYREKLFLTNDRVSIAAPAPSAPSAATADTFPFKKGERLVYQVTMSGLGIGRSELLYDGITTLDNRQVAVVRFITKTIKLFDEEKIFADTETFLPLRIERSIRLLGKKENIVEDYNQDAHSVIITKTVNGRVTHETIQGDAPFENIICLIYQFRRKKDIAVDSVINVTLPLKKIDFRFAGTRFIKVPKGRFEAYIIESVPRKYHFYLSKDESRIPLSIDGAIGIAKTRMVLQEVNTDTESEKQ